MKWKLNSNAPVYSQLVDIITMDILKGEYIMGEKFKSVRDIASEAKVNPNTMQKALVELENKGLLISNGTLGRIVTEDASVIERLKLEIIENNVYDFLKTMQKLNVTKQEVIEIISKQEIDYEANSGN